MNRAGLLSTSLLAVLTAVRVQLAPTIDGGARSAFGSHSDQEKSFST
jgi:hypothetical protein